jgi:sigma-B regulation protein RsbU (phosphoserine phosphatase)
LQVWREEQRVLDRGQRLLLYTDGVVEAEGEDEMFGIERLERAVLAAASPEPDRLLPRILEAVEGFGRGRPRRDDLTLLSVEID